MTRVSRVGRGPFLGDRKRLNRLPSHISQKQDNSHASIGNVTDERWSQRLGERRSGWSNPSHEGEEPRLQLHASASLSPRFGRAPPHGAPAPPLPRAPARPVWSWIQMLGQEAARYPADLRILGSGPMRPTLAARPESYIHLGLGALPCPHSDVLRVRNTHVGTVPHPYAAQGNLEFGLR